MKCSVLILLSFFVFACGNPSETDQSKESIEEEGGKLGEGGAAMGGTAVAPVKVIENILEDPSLTEQGLITGLYGNWINEADVKDMMVFSGVDLARIYDGKMKEMQKPAFFVKCPAGCDTKNSPDGNNKCIKITDKKGSDECFVFEELTKAKMTFKRSGSDELVVYNKQK